MQCRVPDCPTARFSRRRHDSDQMALSRDKRITRIPALRGWAVASLVTRVSRYIGCTVAPLSIQRRPPRRCAPCPTPTSPPTQDHDRHDKSDLVASADSLIADPMAHEKLPRGKERLVHSVIHHYQPKGPRKDPVVRRRYQTVLSSALSAAP